MPNCSKDPSFSIICNTATNPPRAYLKLAQMVPLEVLEIDFSYIYVRVIRESIAYSIYDHVGDYVMLHSMSWRLGDSPYTFSSGNWITAIGCDIRLTLIGILGDVIYTRGCSSTCPSKKNSDDILSCPDSNNTVESACCRTSIPEGAISLNVDMNVDMTSMSQNISHFFHNGYAYIGEELPFNRSVHLTELDKNPSAFIGDEQRQTRVSLNWRITGARNCSEASKDKTGYACKANTFCFEPQITIAPGYLCNCVMGYTGNPYLEPGRVEFPNDHSRRDTLSQATLGWIAFAAGCVVSALLLTLAFWLVRRFLPQQVNNSDD